MQQWLGHAQGSCFTLPALDFICSSCTTLQSRALLPLEEQYMQKVLGTPGRLFEGEMRLRMFEKKMCLIPGQTSHPGVKRLLHFTWYAVGIACLSLPVSVFVPACAARLHFSLGNGKRQLCGKASAEHLSWASWGKGNGKTWGLCVLLCQKWH